MLAGGLRVGCATNEATGSHVVESRHLHLRNNETASINAIDDLSSVHVRIGLDKSELGLFAASEPLASCCVAVVNDLELSGVHVDNGRWVARVGF